jgi:hypothetical protein
VQELRDARAMNQQVFQLQGQVAELQMQLANAQRAPAPGAAADPKDVETWGEDLLQAARRQARAELQGEISSLRNELTQIKATTTNVNQAVSRQSLEAQLSSLVGPDWQTINNDQRFVVWLAEQDLFSGKRRHDMLIAARDAGDANRVAAFFNAYKQHTAGHTPPSSAPAHTPAGASPVTLESLAAPGPGREIGNGADSGRQLITQREIAQFYSDVNKGKYAGREAEKQARERQIFEASAQGRVVG